MTDQNPVQVPVPDNAYLGQCTVGLEGWHRRCPYGAVAAIALGVIPTPYHGADEPTRGVAALCERHLAAAPATWAVEMPAVTTAPPGDQCPDCGQTGRYDGRVHIGGRGIYRCPNGHMWQDADETPSDAGYTPITVEEG